MNVLVTFGSEKKVVEYDYIDAMKLHSNYLTNDGTC
jgi:hypothetical protein